MGRSKPIRATRRASVLTASVLAVLVVLVGACVPTPPPGTTTTTTTTTIPTASQRIDLRVLILADGGPGTNAMKAALDLQGVPYVEVDLNSPSRPTITAAFLADTADGVRRSKFQAVVVPNDTPTQLGSDERAAIADVEREFSLRQVDSYVYPNSAVGLNAPFYSGVLDGSTANVSASALAGPFSDLRGPVPIDDVDPAVAETYGYLATPLDAQPADASFEPLVTASAPTGGPSGSLIGVYTADGRERMVVTAAMNGFQSHLLALSSGIVEWATRGVHLGAKRNSLSVHADDVFVADARWSIEHNCTPTAGDCTDPSLPALPGIRMTVADSQYLRQWQQDNGFEIDLAFNGIGHSIAIVETGSDPMGDDLIAHQDSYRWINHTWDHEYLGCVREFSTVPWHCQGGPLTPQWVTAAVIDDQVRANITWANSQGISIDPSELVTGEHSGLRHSPQEPSDNPSFDGVLATLGITAVGSDASREPRQRRLDPSGALTLPRYPMSVYYNVGTAAELVDEYNWIYNSAADGGSGNCETDPLATCIDPLDPATGFDSYIRPLETRLTLLRVLAGKPYAHYAHQSNITEDRLLYGILEDVLANYRALYSPDAPLENPSLGTATDQVRRIQAWGDEIATVSGGTVSGGTVSGGTGSGVEAYLQDGKVHVSSATNLDVPLTVPEGATSGGSPFGTPWGGRLSGWVPLGGSAQLTVQLAGP